MTAKNVFMYNASAAMAIVSTVAYHFFVKKIPEGINPIVSVIGIYAVTLVIAVVILPFTLGASSLVDSFRQLSWVQLVLAVVVLGMELSFLLMYRYGWDLSVGNVVTGVFINIVLMAIGMVFLRERLSPLNIVGLVMCVGGVAMVGYRPGAG